jgi:hypothetical protein
VFVTGALCNRWQEAKEEVVQGQGYDITAISISISITRSCITSTIYPTVKTISNSRRERPPQETEPNGTGIVGSVTTK